MSNEIGTDVWTVMEGGFDPTLHPRPGGPEEELLLTGLNAEAAQMEAMLDSDLIIEKQRPPHPHDEWNYASELGHPCQKHLVHCRVDWRERRAADIEGFWRMDEGESYERKAKARLMRIGYELTMSQSQFRWQEFRISGRVDGMSPIRRALPPPFQNLQNVPAEVKSINPRYWDSTRTVEEIRQHRGWWIRGYPSQLNLYLLMAERPGGFFILATFGKRPRILPMLVDWNLGERDLVMARKVNNHVAAGTYPAPIPYDKSICGMCGFNHLCKPLRTTSVTVEITGPDEAELQAFIQFQDEFRDARTMYEKYKDKLIGDKKAPGRYYGHTAFVSDIEIKSDNHHRKAFSVKETDFIVTSIERVTP